MLEDLKPHLQELRKRLSYSLGTVIVMFCFMFMIWEPILQFMTLPLKEILPEGSELIALELQEKFFVAIKVSFFAALLVSLPIIFWQLWQFVAPGLYENEKKFVIPFVTFATMMFLLGAAFSYYVVIPYGYEFLVNFGDEIAKITPSLGKYVGFFTKIVIGFGIAFELPVATLFLAKMGLVTDETLKGFFKYAVVLIFILSALLTPPDVITQFLMAGPMILLYGVSIMIAKAINPEPTYEEDEDFVAESQTTEDTDKK